ncbi:MAG: hypothetical protein IT385_01145 [Deltaproteobacteria bacterium]|nr:hypothetical protein [Deltaproteobacteria bacterium]
MKRRRPLTLAALLLVACPSDPRFVAGDGSAHDTETESETETEVAMVDDGDAQEIDPPETSTCPPPCGPLAECLDGACRCPDDLCDGEVTAQPVEELVLLMREVDVPVVVYERFQEVPDMALTSWGGASWVHEPVFARDYGLPLDATLDHLRRPVVLTSTGDREAQFSWETGPGQWHEENTYQSTCAHAAIDFDPTASSAVIGCSDEADARYLLTSYHLVSGSSNLPPMALGQAPNPNVVRFAFDAVGQPWVVYSAPSTGGAAISVAHYDAGEWQHEPLEGVKLPTGAVRGPPIALGLDGLSKPHVVYVHLRDGGLALTHRVRTGTDTWASADISFDGPLDGLGVLDLEGGPGAVVHLLMVRRDRLVWLALAASDVIGSASRTADADVIDADLATDADGAPWVAYAPGRTGIRLWRPGGP